MNSWVHMLFGVGILAVIIWILAELIWVLAELLAAIADWIIGE